MKWQRPQPTTRPPPTRIGSSASSALRGFVVTPDFVLRIAPAFRGWVRSARPGWGELIEAAWLVRSDLGISQHAWGQACVVLGRMEAVTVLAVVAARHAAGKVRSPGGLLRRMVELHQEGRLRLDRTLFGLADGLGARRH
jgi:replication initiation protein RepC